MRVKLLLLLVLSLALPLSANAAPILPQPAPIQAQSEGDLAEWRWPTLGLTFQYPSTWTAVNEQGFDFLLVESTEAGANTGFVGVQSAPVEAGSSVEDTMLQLVVQYGGEAEEIDLGGVLGYRLEFAPDTGRQVRLIGFEPSEGIIALFVFSSLSENWEAFSALADAIESSASITPLALDTADLDSALSQSFADGQFLRLGSPDAPIKIVEVVDFSCPHCARYELSIERLIQDYVLTGQAQLEFRLATFVGNQLSEVATQAQYCAADLGFGWQMHERLFQVQLQEGANMFTTENINSIVRTLEGVDAAAFETCLAEAPYSDLIERDAQFIQDNDVQGTPSLMFAQGDAPLGFMLGSSGDPLRGAIPLAEVYTYLDGLLVSE